MEAQFSSGMCDVNAKFFEIELSPKNVEATERIYTTTCERLRGYDEWVMQCC